MDRQEATEALALLRTVVSQARDDTTLQNWGVIWMIHAVTNGGGFCFTNWMMWQNYDTPWPYVALWSVIVVINIGSIFLLKKQTAGTRTFIESQIWNIWNAYIVAVVLTGLINHIGGFRIFTLGPAIGVLTAYAFAMMGAVIGRVWYWLAGLFGVASLCMAAWPDWQFIILGVLFGICQFVAGLQMHRARLKQLQPPRVV